MKKIKFKGQTIVEYALIGALVIAATLPAIQPLANNIGKSIEDSAPRDNNKQVANIDPAAKVGEARTPSGATTTTSAEYTDPNLGTGDPGDPGIPNADDVEVPEVFMFSSYNAYKWDENLSIFDQVVAGAYDANFDGVLDNLKQDVKSAIKQMNSKGKTYDKSIFINKDGSLAGIYDGSTISSLNGNFLWSGEKLKNHLGSDYFKAIGTIETGYGKDIDDADEIDKKSHTAMYYTSGRKIKLPNGREVFVENNAIYSPIVFDLNGDGIKTTEHLINYDLNGDGKKDTMHDIEHDGVLCIRGGKSGLDLFGDNTDLNNDGKRDGFKNGFESLKALARNEKLINDKDDMKLDEKDIDTLHKKYGLALKIGYLGKAKTLKSLGVTEINLPKTSRVGVVENFDKKGNILMLQEGATIKINGQTNIFADVWHNISEMAKKVINSISSLF